MHLDEVCHGVAGLVPVYDDKGDSCLVFCRSGEGKSLTKFTEPHAVETVKRQLARCYALDLTAQGIILRRAYQRSTPLPFYLYDGRVYVPLKMRQPKVTGDATYGYLEMSIISKVVPNTNNRCNVILSDGSSLPVYTQINTARLAVYFGIEVQRDIFSGLRGKQHQALQALRTLHTYLNS